MMSMMNTETAIETAKCLRCGYEWEKRKPGRPKACPNCKQPKWDTQAWAVKVRRGRKVVSSTSSKRVTGNM